MIGKKGLKKKLDKAFSTYIRSIKKNCEYCKNPATNVHHIVGRRHLGLRWNPANACLLCSFHHIFSSTFSAHQTPTYFTDWLYEVRPADMEFLNKWKAKTLKWTIEDMQELLVKLK